MIKTAIKWVLNRYGYKVVAVDTKSFGDLAQPQDYMGDDFKNMWHELCLIMNQNSFSPSFYTTYKAIRFVVANGIEGDLVETGVHRGAQCVVMALTLKRLGETGRKIFLYDTFEGMPPPGDRDFDLNKQKRAIEIWNTKQRDGISDWNYCTFDKVKQHVLASGYGEDNFVFVKGKVQETLTRTKPGRLAVLRLDTNFYESTSAEMHHLYPRLSERGVLIVDGFGRWVGQKRAQKGRAKPVGKRKLRRGGRRP